MRLPSVMTHSFSRVPQANIPRSSFDRSHGLKTTLDAGWLVPVFVDEVLPGDTLSCSMTGFARLSTPLRPFLDNLWFNSFFFFVPNRLLWDNWQRFNGEQDNPGDSTDYLVPEIRFASGDSVVGSIHDYFGLPTGVPFNAAALHHRAYNLIWNEWFRDQNLQDSVAVPKDDGPDPVGTYALLKRGKRHDYFTSCLPWPQKGESVSIPLGTFAPVFPGQGGPGGAIFPTFYMAPAGNPGGVTSALYSHHEDTTVLWGVQNISNPQQAGWQDPALYTDLSSASAATINQLRQAFQVQKLYERDARGGSRYTEIVRSHFGVVSPDARLQRPEYLGGGQSAVNLNPVANTTGPTSQSDAFQGDLAAFGTSVMHGHGFSKSFTEHGVVIGMVCVRADLTYQQGLNRMWSRRARFDYYWPALSHIGEQAVLSQEIYCDGSTGDQDVFGYQERYAEYRYKPSVITGQMRSSFAQSLDVWHLSQEFAARPLLNATFIAENPPIARVVAVPSEPAFVGDFYFKYRCVRPMPVYGVPGLIDHF